jgi:glycosyltransferase involved in cell wall biosynthesis
MFVTNSLTGGGAERSMNLVSNELTERGWPIALVPINSGDADLVTPMCEVFPLDRDWKGNIFNTFLAILKFNKIVKSWKPDVIILNCDLPELFGALLTRRQQIVVVEHSNLAWSQRARLGKLVRKILSRRKAVWIAVSSHLGIWPDGHVPRAVLQNPLTPSTRATRADRPSSILKRLVFLGRLSPEKRPRLLLEIGAQSGFEVEIIGDGFLKKQLQDETTKRNLKVTFHGYVHNPWSLFQPGDLLIVPSASEGDGLVVIEGMDRGIPMLLSDIADFRRFGLPDKHYCQSVEDFIARINQHLHNLDTLVVPEELKGSIIASRSLEGVGNSWEKFINSI